MSFPSGSDRSTLAAPPLAALFKWLPFLLVFIAVALLSLHFRVFTMDEYTYMNAADAFARHDPSLILAGEIGRFYGFPIVLHYLVKAGLDVEIVGKALNLFFYAASVGLIYIFAKKLIGKEAAYWSALLFASNPFLLFLSTRVLTESMFVFLFTASLFALWHFVKDPKYWLPVFGFLTASLVMTRFVGLYIFFIAVIYLWREQKLSILLSKYAILAALVFIFGFGLFLITPPSTDTLFERITNFVVAQVNVQQGDLSLPDRIPSYFLLLPFTLAFALPWLWRYVKKPGELLSPALALPSLAILGVALSMELYGMFNFRLFRYLAPVIPFLCMLAAHSIVQLKGKTPVLPFAKRFSWNQWAYAAVLLNVLLGLVLVVGVYTQYQKHVAYSEAGSFAAANCPSTIFSNIPAVVIHYTKRPVAYFTNSAPISEACVLKSSYDAWNFDPYFPVESYRLLYDRQGIAVYART